MEMAALRGRREDLLGDVVDRNPVNHRRRDSLSGYSSDSGLERSDSFSSEDDISRPKKSVRFRCEETNSSDDGFEAEKFNDEATKNGCEELRTDEDGDGCLVVEKHVFESKTDWLVVITPTNWTWLKETEWFVNGYKRKGSKSCVEIHTLTDSLFSTSSGFTNYRGLLNLCIVLLVLSNSRVAIENLITYGILIEPFMFIEYIFRDVYSWPCCFLLLASNVFIMVCFFIEKALSTKTIAERFGVILHTVNCTSTLVFPAVAILVVHPIPFISSMTLGYYTCLFLKMISYACVNKWCREKYFTPKRRKTLSSPGDAPEGNWLLNDLDEKYGPHLQQYPDNLHLKDLYYFVGFPTLCYELNFPRTERIRIRFLLKRVAEMLFMVQIIAALVQQWMIPTVNNTLEPFMNSNITVTITRIFKLAIPNHFIWLLFFYWFFHSCLNVVAELLRFGDREFYKDWWNAESVSAFWQTWNIPVHRWGKRHLYVPMLRWGFTKFQASVTVFLVSAFFHEYLVSIPLRMFKLWAFMGMAGQIPFAIFVSKFLHGKYGNMAVWLSIILGQPVAILMYVHDYYVLHNMR